MFVECGADRGLGDWRAVRTIRGAESASRCCRGVLLRLRDYSSNLTRYVVSGHRLIQAIASAGESRGAAWTTERETVLALSHQTNVSYTGRELSDSRIRRATKPPAGSGFFTCRLPAVSRITCPTR